MSVTVGIATTGDEPEQVCAAVRSTLHSAAQLSPAAEVLVVVNGRDRVPELAAIDAPQLRIRYLAERGVGAARNVVLDEARHDTILFTDDDCVVPPEWCAQLHTALHEPGWAAVGAPVRLPVQGPVSAYCDYVRLYDAIPSGVDGPLMLVTTNCGLRRDLIPRDMRFHACVREAGGEDTGLSVALWKAGLRSRWLEDATPIRHGFSEDIAEITERYMRYASNGLHLYFEHGAAESGVPGILDFLRQRVQEDSPFDRRFAEFVAAPVRSAFAAYDALATAATAVGYLNRLGAEFDQPLLDLDLSALRSSWRRIADEAARLNANMSTSDWSALKLDYPGMASRLGQVDPLVTQVWESVRRHARPTDVTPTGRLADVLNHGAAAAVASALGRLQVRHAFDELCGRPGASTDDLDRLARERGMSLKVALDAVEFTYRVDVDTMVQRWRSRRQRQAAAAVSR